MPGGSGGEFEQTKVMWWLQKAVDREEWAPLIKEARALREPESQEVSI